MTFPYIRLCLGQENVQAAQKYITGLDARRLAKYSEDRYVSAFIRVYSLYVAVAPDSRIFIFIFPSMPVFKFQYVPRM